MFSLVTWSFSNNNLLLSTQLCLRHWRELNRLLWVCMCVCKQEGIDSDCCQSSYKHDSSRGWAVTARSEWGEWSGTLLQWAVLKMNTVKEATYQTGQESDASSVDKTTGQEPMLAELRIMNSVRDWVIILMSKASVPLTGLQTAVD